jgi:GT2 family glycosyltransferase
MEKAIQRPSVAVIIPNFNGWRDSESCLLSLERALASRDLVLFVDNGSSDGSFEAATEWFAQRENVWSADLTTEALHYRIIRLPLNVGFGRACNAGFEAGDGYQFFWLLNNDTEVEPSALTNLAHAAMEKPDAGFVGSYVYVWPDKEEVWFNGAVIDVRTGDAVHLLGKRSSEIVEVGYVSGCSMLIRADVVNACGGFHQEFFMYYEETELQLRARSFGFRSYLAPESIVGHKVSTREGVSSFRGYHTMRSQLLFLRMHGTDQVRGIPWAIFKRVGSHLIRRRLHAVLPTVRGAWAGLTAPSNRARKGNSLFPVEP